MFTNTWFDDLARGVAGPVSRRRAVGMMLGVLVGAVSIPAWPRPARGENGCPEGQTPVNNKCCPIARVCGSAGVHTLTCCPDATPKCCGGPLGQCCPENGLCCGGKCCSVNSPVCVSYHCCPAGTLAYCAGSTGCCAGVCVQIIPGEYPQACCPVGTTSWCAGQCCEGHCVAGQCCPPDRFCFGMCCKQGQTCQPGSVNPPRPPRCV